MRKWEFIEETVMLSTMRAAVARNVVYNQTIRPANQAKEAMKQAFQDAIRDLLPLYENVVGDKDHENNILLISNKVSKAFPHVLQNSRLRIGTVQKAFNLYLKYMWCLGKISIPPHCPFDSVVIGYLDISPAIQWTRMDSIVDYRNLVTAAKVVMKANNIDSLAEWELKTFRDHW